MDSYRTIFEIALPLFLIMDPIGNVAACIAILRDFSAKQQMLIILRELLFALAIMIFFQFLGGAILKILDLEQSTLRLAGGVVLFIISLKMVFPEERGSLQRVEKDPFFVPIATPFIAGPSLLAAIMLYSRQEEGSLILFAAIMLAWLATSGIMLLATSLKDKIGPRGSRAAERLMGLILVLLSVKMMEEGVRMFMQPM